jgi:hypothetical protein
MKKVEIICVGGELNTTAMASNLKEMWYGDVNWGRQ